MPAGIDRSVGAGICIRYSYIVQPTQESLLAKTLSATADHDSAALDQGKNKN